MIIEGKFQYISCYCLSQQTLERLWCLPDFNTSHVTVYRFQIVVAQHRETYFNTSHVTVYHCKT